MMSNGLIVNWEYPPHHRVKGQVLDVLIAKQIGIVLSHDVERMVEMCAQAYKAGYIARLLDAELEINES